MTTHTIKLNKALKKAQVGQYPRSAEAMVAHLPILVIESCTSSEIAAMLDAMYGACQKAKAIAERDACAEGCIWDAAQKRLREIQ